MEAWVPILVAAIAATPPTLVALVAMKRASVANANVQGLRIEVDGRLDALIKASGAEGEVRGRAAAHRERGERAGEEL